jgi:hypothetical protein
MRSFLGHVDTPIGETGSSLENGGGHGDDETQRFITFSSQATKESAFKVKAITTIK